MKYRTRSEIIAQMLEAAKGDLVGITKSRIMYRASLSFTQLREYLRLVLDRELLEYDAGNNRYRLTQKGVQYLEMFQKTKSILDV